jgi:hypothetical protein
MTRVLCYIMFINAIYMYILCFIMFINALFMLFYAQHHIIQRIYFRFENRPPQFVALVLCYFMLFYVHHHYAI